LSQPVRDFSLFGAAQLPEGTFALTYAEPAAVPEIDEVQLRFNRGNELFAELLNQPLFTGTGSLTLPAELGSFEPGTGISLRVTDACGREVTTNEVVPTSLSGRPLFAGQNLLNWTAFTNELDGMITYDLFRAEVPFGGAAAGANFVPIASELTDLAYTDADLLAFSGQACYRIEAVFRSTGDVPQPTYRFASNTICLSPPTEVYVPNAFSPSSLEATNQVFRPYFSTPPPAAGYELLVFDRWGGIRFRSTDPMAGWPGTSDGQALTSGTYLYQLRYVDNAGQTRQLAGTVNLIR
ncbi:MAG: gliding motility-associated C-terminal domain-containing protein, partial [Bacteroidota bacterium]